MNYGLLKWDPCELWERREKGVFRAAHPHTPLLGQCPHAYFFILRIINILQRTHILIRFLCDCGEKYFSANENMMKYKMLTWEFMRMLCGWLVFDKVRLVSDGKAITLH